MSHEQIAEMLGISKRRVIQLERRAMMKIRRELARRGIFVEALLGGPMRNRGKS